MDFFLSKTFLGLSTILGVNLYLRKKFINPKLITNYMERLIIPKFNNINNFLETYSLISFHDFI